MLEWMTQWQCSRCTYVQKSLKKCGMCEEPRPKETLVSPLVKRTVTLPVNHSTINWLDRTDPSVELFKQKFGTTMVGDPNQKTSTFFSIPASTHANLRTVVTEMHSLFVRATEHVLKTPHLWPSFDFPEAYWPRAIKSFSKQDVHLAGRFDFAINPDGIKCFEYNADSASCLFECGYTQAAWSNAAGIGHVGVDAGIGLEDRLIAAWHQIFPNKGTVVHFLHDSNDEERYHAGYMMECARKAGLECYGVDGKELTGFSFNAQGGILDEQKREVKHIWKTWSYVTLFGLWDGKPLSRTGQVRLVDVCLSEDITVLEPLWAAIPASKAILPVLSGLFPGHPNLLQTTYKPTSSMLKKGYVSKPTSGRCGENITIHQPGSQPIKSEGKFGENLIVYQELCVLPKLDGTFVQVNAFSVMGLYGGTVLRIDDSAIIGLQSESVVLRVVDDGCGAPLPTAKVGREKPLRTGQPAPFGAVMGLAPGGIPAYSCDYDMADENIYPNRRAYRHQIGDLYYGFRFQCVEFARRWLIHAQGLTFGDVGMAYEIFEFKAATDVRTQAKVPWTNVRNGGKEKPVAGSVLIWSDGGEFRWTGHVAIITEATDTYVRLAEQNVDDAYWPPGQTWSRELAVRVENGSYHILEPRGAVLGWKNIPKNYKVNPFPMTIDTYEQAAMRDYEAYHS